MNCACGKPAMPGEDACEDCLVDSLVEFAENYDPKKDEAPVQLRLYGEEKPS